MSDQVIAILDEEGNQLFSTAVNINVAAIESKTFASHSLENKQVVVDDQFDNPGAISMQMILNPVDYQSVYSEIKAAYKAVTNFTIQTRVDTYTNMYLAQLPHEESPEMFNTIAITLEFTEQIIAGADSETMTSERVSSKSDASTVNAGQKSSTDNDGTVLQRLAGRFF
jgi:hypothetical protein